MDFFCHRIFPAQAFHSFGPLRNSFLLSSSFNSLIPKNLAVLKLTWFLGHWEKYHKFVQLTQLMSKLVVRLRVCRKTYCGLGRLSGVSNFWIIICADNWAANTLKQFFRATVLAVLLAVSGQLVLAQDFHKGLDAYHSGDFETALQEWRPLAEQGNADAQNNLAWM